MQKEWDLVFCGKCVKILFQLVVNVLNRKLAHLNRTNKRINRKPFKREREQIFELKKIAWHFSLFLPWSTSKKFASHVEILLKRFFLFLSLYHFCDSWSTAKRVAKCPNSHVVTVWLLSLHPLHNFPAWFRWCPTTWRFAHRSRKFRRLMIAT